MREAECDRGAHKHASCEKKYTRQLDDDRYVELPSTQACLVNKINNFQQHPPARAPPTAPCCPSPSPTVAPPPPASRPPAP